MLLEYLISKSTMNNPADYLKIAVIAFMTIWIINRALKAAGLSQYTTNAAAGNPSK
jgi:hypothetical protein